MQTQTTIEDEAISGYLTELWKTIFAKDISEQDNFFDTGGSSLTAIRMIMKVQADLSVELDVESFFEQPTIRYLVNCIHEART